MLPLMVRMVGQAMKCQGRNYLDVELRVSLKDGYGVVDLRKYRYTSS